MHNRVSSHQGVRLSKGTHHSTEQRHVEDARVRRIREWDGRVRPAATSRAVSVMR